MNKNNYRLVFSRLRNMLVAVEETATATGKEAGQTSVRSKRAQGVIFTLRQIAFAILALLGALPTWSGAQIVPGGAHAPGVIATQNGLPQVNINRPSGAGVSMNTYGQFDVQKNGAILNNSPTIVQTQQAGMINGNPNFGPGQSARVIVNQVNSSAASQINGRVEVAGQRAEVVIANGSGISVNGGGFINTSRAILTTGTPNFAADGSLAGFNVTGGNINIQGAGFNAGDVDQVDLLARAVQANAAIYAKNLNVVTGANSIDHSTLNATPIAGSGPAPGVSIDVSQLGGMYANRIVLVGTENGVGVSNKGVLAAQAGELTLTTQGKLVLTGQTNASGNINVSARDGIDNSGTTYAQQNVSANTLGALTNSGVLAAQKNTTVNAGSVTSNGTLGAGVNSDGMIANAGDLSIFASGAITATGQNEGGGNTNISGASVNLAGSNTSANGTLALAANGGDLNLSGASTTAGGALVANTAGTLVNDSGKMSGGLVQVTAASMSNRNGQLVSGSTLNVTAASEVSNQSGTMQAAGAMTLNTGSLDNTTGRIVSLNGDGLNIAARGALNNGASGSIGTNGALNLNAGTLANQGQLTALGDATVRAQSIDNHAGTITAGGALGITSTGTLNNLSGTLSGSTTAVSGSSIDNTNGDIEGDTLAVSASGDLVNRGGKLTQFGTADQTIQAGGTLDNTGGTIASNANTLRISGQAVTNDKGNIQHAGTGALALNANGALSNVAGNVVTNGALAVQAAGGLNNVQGAIQASRRADMNAASLNNTGGRIAALNGDGLNVTVTGALLNGVGGTIGTNGTLGVGAGVLSNQGKLTAASDATARAQSIDNHAGTITAGGALNVTSTSALNNSNGTLSGSTTTVSGSSIDNTNGDIEGDALAVSATGNIANQGGTLTQYGTANQTIQVGGTLDNTSGTLATNANSLSISAQSITNDHGTIQHAGTGTLAVSAAGVVSNVSGNILSNGALAIQSQGAIDNQWGTMQAAHRTTLSGASLDNTAGRIVSLNGDGLNATVIGALVNGTNGTIGTNGALEVNAETLLNQGTLTASGDASVRAQSIDNHAGTITAGGALTAASAGALNNIDGTLSGAATVISAASIDNTHGDINGDALALSISGDLANDGGTLTQYGTTDQTIQVGGTFENTSGTLSTNANNLSVSAQAITNDHGTIQHAGTGALSLNATGALSNVGGSAQTNGALTVNAASLDNTSGTLLAMQWAHINAASGIVNRDGSLYGGSGLAVSTQGDIDTTRGSMQTSGDLSVEAGGTITNAQGTLSANGAHGTANVSAARIDNSGGKLTNAGDGTTTLSASAITNTRGTLGGNGDVTVNAQTLENDAGANLVVGGAANLNITERVNNAGGTLFGATALNLNQVNAAVINDGGAMLSGLDVLVNVASMSNLGGAIRANRDVGVSAAVSGNGDVIAGRDLALAVVGDYTNDAGNNLHADGNMRVSATGTLTNTGMLAANGALTASGANVVNTADGDINSSSTTINASNAITNAGRIEGDTVITNSAALANAGAIIGNDVTVNATDITNTGAAAVIAGANRVRLYVSNSVTNADGALIYSLGNLEIARDGTRDASGMLANQTGALTNSAASIEAEGDIDIAARTLSNLRTGAVTEAGTPQDAGTTTLTLWTAGLSTGSMGYYYSKLYPEWRWSDGAIGTGVIGHLMHPITVKVRASQVTNLDPAAQSFSLTVPLTDTYSAFAGGETSTRTITNNATQWYSGITDNGNGTYSITFWPDFDPNKNIRPDQVRVDDSLGKDNHDYVEMKYTTQTTTTTDQLVSAGNAATIQAQGAIRINADNGSINNTSSTMAAGGDLVRRATNGSVNDTGTVLQQTTIDTATSDWYWHQKTGGSSDYQANVDDAISRTTTTVDALPAIATSNQTVQTDAQTISINSVNRQGQTVNGSGVTGGSADGTQLGGITGQSTSTGVSGTTTGSVSGQSSSSGVSGTTASNVSGQSSNPQTVGGASGGIPNLKLPVSGLYTYNTAPDASYLIATDPRFTQYSNFISSDYMLGQLGLDPSKTEKRLGDGMYEQTLVRNQVTQLTGRTFLTGYASNLDEYTALMNSGITYAKEFGLAPGIALTPLQMQQLTTDMVWLVSQDVALPDGSHQTVLVPQVYLAQSSTVDLTHSGALVAGNAVNLNASGDVTNSGHVTSNLATTIIGNNVVNSGVIGSSGMTAVVAVQDVRNTSGRIGGGDVVVQAGRDVVNETQSYGISKDFGSNSITGRVTNTGIDAIGTISATGNAAVIAGRDVNITGALIQTGGDAVIAAARDLNLGTTTLIATRDVQTRDALNGSHDAVTQNLGSAIVAGGSLATVSGRDTTLTHATVSANGDATLIAGGNLTVTAAKDTQTHSEQSMGGKQAQHIGSSYDEAAQGTFVGAGGNVTLAAGQNGSGNLAILGSTVTANTGGVRLVSTGDVTIGSVSETHDAQSWSHNQHSGFLSKETTNDAANSHQVISNGSTVSGDTVTGAAGHDMTISGSTIAATHNVTLAAVNNLTINTTQDTSESSTFHEEKKSGFGALSGGGMTLSYGNSDQKDAAHDASVANNASLIGSTNGSVNLAAGNDLHVTGSDLIAAQNITGTGANVIIDAASGATHHDETHERKQSGFTVGLAGSVGDALNHAVSQSEGVSRDAGNGSSSGDSRAAALHGIAAASDAYTVGNAAVGAATGKGVPDIGVQVSFGSAKSSSGFSEDQTRNSGSTVQAGGTAAFVATGNGTPGSGNLTIAGSNVSANDVVLAAKDKLNIVNTTDTDATRSSNGVSSASVGVSLTTVGGAGISASMQNAHGDANSDAATQNASHVTGANSVTVISGGDTNIIGSQINGRQITADVGGDLNVVSVQDKTTSAAKQQSSGGDINLSQGGGSASASTSHGNASGNYQGVNEQAGIQAGAGGFDITVHGNTDLKGAVIASDADASKSSLTTGTLSFSDIVNRSSYDAKSGGFSAGGSVGLPDKAVGPSSVPNSGGITPSLSQHDSGSDNATTKSAISAGTINVTDQANQTQDIASLNRDTSNTNGTVAKTPDVNSLLDQQADMMSAAAAAGQAVAQRIGDYADAQFEATGDPAWDEGGANRIALHVAGGGLVAGLGGGGAASAAQGAAGAGAAAWSAGDLNRLANGTRDTLGGSDAALTAGNVLANVVAGTGGFLIGGTTGAFAGSNADLYNRSTGNGDDQGSTANSAVDTARNSAAGVWNGLVSIGEMIANAPNGGPFASPGDPGYISADGLHLPYTAGDQVGPGVEFWAAVLATKGTGKGATAEAKALTKAETFERSLVNLPPGERVAQVKQTAQTVAADNGWTKDAQLSRLNGRDVYRADDGNLYAVDSQHGRFEQVNAKTGSHMGEVSMLDLKPTKPADTSGRHDLKLQ